MKFESLLSRIDEEIIQQIIGRSPVKILNILDRNLSNISNLQKAVLQIYSPSELLSNRAIRNSLFEILKPAEAEQLLICLGQPLSGDHFDSIKNLKFNSKDLFERLFAFFEIPPSIDINIDVEPKEKITIASYPLFPHQRKAIRQLLKFVYFGNKRVLLHMPTGSGKTRSAMNLICNHLRSYEPTVVIWLAHTEELCDQAATEFEKAWGNLGDRELPIIRYWGEADIDVANLSDCFIVGGLMKVYNLLKRDSSSFSKLSSHLSLVVMDEAHMAIAPTYKSSIEILLSFDASLLGLSATPGRTWNDPQADLELSQFFDRKKVTLQIDGYDNPVDYLVDNGYLAKIINKPLMYDSGIAVTEKDLEYLKQYLELPDKFLKALSEDQARNIRIIQKAEELISRHRRIILFALNVEHSNLLATCLQARGVSAYSLTSNTDPDQRRRLIELFKGDGEEPIILCNYGILTTGFDAPKTSCAIICRPTDSLVLYSQMVGRAIRGVNAGGNNEAEIVTVIDTVLPGFDKIQAAFFNWEDVW